MRDTLTKVQGVKSVEVDKASRTATIILETEQVNLETVLDKLSKDYGGRYRGSVVKQEKLDS